MCMRIINSGCYFSMCEWRNIVWEKLWQKEDEDCVLLYKQPNQKFLLFEIPDKPYYLLWWILADMFPGKMHMCDIMATRVCETGLLKSNDYRLKKKSFSHKICTRCNLGILESISRIVMQCPLYIEERNELHLSLSHLNTDVATGVINDALNYFHTIIGKQPEYVSLQDMISCWRLHKQAIQTSPNRPE